MSKSKKAKTYLRTESGNAELFGDRYGKVVKFDHGQGRWLVWDDKQNRWIEDRQGQVRTAMKTIARLRLRQARRVHDDDERTKQSRWALRSESRHGIDNALELAKSIKPVADSGEKWDVNPWLLGVANGVVDLRTGRLRTTKPEDRITLYSPVPFDPMAECPRFDTFILEVCGGDVDLVAFIQRAVGYTLTGCNDEQCFFSCYGTGANGKSTFLALLRHILGDYAVNLPFSAFELNSRSTISNDVAMLAGRRFATAIETGENVRLNEARIKAITGGDPITARLLYRENFTFSPTHKLWLAFNHKPRILDESEGMWRRVRVIPFMQHFDGANRDNHLLDTLKSEAPGILAWAVRGALMWQRGGLGQPKAVTAASSAYREESDHLREFLSEYCIVDPKATVTAAALWQSYQQWADDAGIEPLSRSALVDRLRNRGFKDERFGHDGTRGWRGLQLSKSGRSSAPVGTVSAAKSLNLTPMADTLTCADTVS